MVPEMAERGRHEQLNGKFASTKARHSKDVKYKKLKTGSLAHLSPACQSVSLPQVWSAAAHPPGSVHLTRECIWGGEDGEAGCAVKMNKILPSGRSKCTPTLMLSLWYTWQELKHKFKLLNFKSLLGLRTSFGAFFRSGVWQRLTKIATVNTNNLA